MNNIKMNTPGELGVILMYSHLGKQDAPICLLAVQIGGC